MSLWALSFWFIDLNADSSPGAGIVVYGDPGWPSYRLLMIC